MANQISFTEENVKKNAFDFPKLKLAKGERARLTIVESPYVEYVHNIQKPILNEDGTVQYKTQERKNGTEYTVPKLAFVSNPICLGTTSVLDENGLDPDNCPVCARAARGEKGYFPKRRFAMHVIRTNTKPNSFDPLTPPSRQLIIWAFTDNVFAKIVEYQKQWGLNKHDLQLGPCEDATFQKAELNIAPDVAVTPAEIAEYFAKENQASDPTVFCGNKKTRKFIEEDLAIVDETWARAKGEDDSLPTSSGASLTDGIKGLLDEDTTTGVPSESVSPVTSFDDLVTPKSTDEEGWFKEPEAETVSEPEPAAEPEKKPTELSVDDILAGL